jgi:glucose/arabinose dehydrogenase
LRRVNAVAVGALVLGGAACGGAKGSIDETTTIPTVIAATTTTTTAPTTTAAPTGTGSTDTTAAAPATTVVPTTAPATPDLGAVQVALTKVADVPAPTAMAMRPGDDQTIFIASQNGIISPIRDGQVDAPILDISSQTRASGERGLLGLAFSPDGSKLYIDYTDVNGDSHIDEYAVGADEVADPASRREVLTQAQPYPNHNGGQLVFGPDGLLYIGFGDGGSGGDPQRHAMDLGTWLGKILRIDPRATGDAPYAIPADNPFVGRNDVKTEIWSYGLRNPWRFSFDAANNDLWIGDVGQGQIEEVDHMTAASGAGRGVNFGWSAYEGTERYNKDVSGDNVVMPVHEYQHGGDGCSISGGFVYRGTAIAALRGAYVFGDYCFTGVRAIDPAAPENATTITDQPPSVSSFGEGPGRELYVLSLAGAVYVLTPA